VNAAGYPAAESRLASASPRAVAAHKLTPFEKASFETRISLDRLQVMKPGGAFKRWVN
jgi:hypothetical protein